MASSMSAPVVISQATKRTHSEISSSDLPSQQNPCVQSSTAVEPPNNISSGQESKLMDTKALSTVKDSDIISKCLAANPSNDLNVKKNPTVSALSDSKENQAKPSEEPSSVPKITTDISPSAAEVTVSPVETKISSNGTSAGKSSAADNKETKNAVAEHIPTSSALTPSSQLASERRIAGESGQAKSTPEPMETSVATGSQDVTARPSIETAASQSKSASNKVDKSTKLNDNKPQLEDGEEPEKKAKVVPASNTSKDGGKTPEQVIELMDKTFEQRRKVVTKQMPSIPELKELYPDLFTGKQLLLEFQRITKIDIDQKIQEFCVRYATAVIELARNKKGAQPVLARWEQAKQENDTLRQYWDMVTALCLLPLHFGENFVEMVLEIGEDEEVVPQGKIVPTLVARGNIFRTDEFFLIAENTIVQEFEEFTIAFASLYSSYWVFNMVYPETIENTYNYIQRCIVRQREPGAIPLECKNFTKTLLRWNKGKEGQ